MIAEIIAVGSEMLTPFRVDTNSLYLTEGLNDLGITVGFKTIVGDSLEHLTGAARNALARADVVIFSGGLGPTEDDMTREAAAGALGIELLADPAILTGLYKRFAERRIAMTPNNVKQADVLDGAEILPNGNGSAPGQMLFTAYEGKERVIILLPGPPKELKLMFTEQVRPRLASRLPARFIARRQVKMALMPESTVDSRTAPIYTQYPDVETTILAHSGEIQLHFECSKATLAEAQERVDEVVSRVEHEMDEDVFSSHGETLEEVVLLMLGMRNMTLAAAESCTGGMLAQRLTSVAGSSRYFLGGAVVYAPELKTTFAGVPEELLEREGTVSEAVSRALAEGIRERTGASIGVGITGVAGPGPGEGLDAGKPAGLVYLAIADELGTEVKELNLGANDRERVRWWSTQHALERVRRRLL
ncbi:competence/damage-inducible protein A [Granulicella sp. WH15]|uniref:competence/damage-inducible protein A n=1 Tax=Granulicella sp. WH15 TaxID=2602070 RepID=UPI00136709C5|nr:competence/damage-inducible protein A [Granulicella sp. WH15]QHN02306.1 competence/damage-inducible protein A [Granulicella sp. WH15]